MQTKDDTSSKIKVIETVYNGYRFRSRLEARWAVFFDSIGLKYEYEREGYDLGNKFGYYLPDFWFPKFKIHCEIKPEDNDVDVALFRHFRDNISPILLIEGPPWEFIGTWFGWDLTDSGGGTSDFNAAIVSIAIPGDNDIVSPCILIEDRRSDRVFGVNELFEPAFRTYNFSTFNDIKTHDDLCDCINTIAILRAKKARFEHGECP